MGMGVDDEHGNQNENEDDDPRDYVKNTLKEKLHSFPVQDIIIGFYFRDLKKVRKAAPFLQHAYISLITSRRDSQI